MRAQRLQYGAQFTDLVGAVRGAAGIAVTGMVMAGSAARIQVVIGPAPTHRAVRVAKCGTVSRNRNRHASTLRRPRDSYRFRPCRGTT